MFKHSGEVDCVTFSADDKHILSGGADKKISEWPISENILSEDGPKDDLMKKQATHQAQTYPDFKILAMNPTVCDACIVGDWPTAERMLNLDIYIDTNDHIAYAHRAFVMAQKCNWDQALEDVSGHPDAPSTIDTATPPCRKWYRLMDWRRNFGYGWL
ncbi:hypothetical protein BDR04DRAFT_1106724 [Suillus decipiens]|nr:hypothetical protein BDR04DRAFT_1106724 [Suillus decipiens]